MKRSKPLRRSPMRRGARRSSYATRPRGTDYMLAVKRLPCAAAILPGHVCSGEIHAHHPKMIGVGMKSHDSIVMPLCQDGHRDLHALAGAFRGFTRARRRAFEIDRVRQVQRYLSARGIFPPEPNAAEAVEIARWFGLGTADELEQPAANPPCTELREDGAREAGNVDVRHPDAAPLPVARVVSEGDR